MPSPPPSSPPAHLPIPLNATAFITLISDSLRLRDETLAMAFIYTQKYRQHLRESPSSADLIDEHTLMLASLSLATKATESPRRLREFLLPAHELLHPTSPPLTFPSPLYDSLRGTLVVAELLLLRIMRFDIRLPLPYDYLPRLLEKTLSLDGTDHLDFLPDAEREEICVIEVKDTSLGKAVHALVAETVRSYRLVNLFPARTVATAAFWVILEERGMRVAAAKETWLKKMCGDKVEFEDFEEAVEEIREMREAGKA